MLHTNQIFIIGHFEGIIFEGGNTRVFTVPSLSMTLQLGKKVFREFLADCISCWRLALAHLSLPVKYIVEFC